jgi:uncharacterized membrane protein YccC
MRFGTYKLPLPGMRTVKTAICVLICLLINFRMGTGLAIYSSIVAIVCMQSTIENTLTTSVNRIVGTAVGGAAGILVIWLAGVSAISNFYLAIIPVGIILTIYICNVIKMPGSSVICAIVYITVASAPLMPSFDSADPYLPAFYRITDTLIGIATATLVNRFIAPPKFYEARTVRLACNMYGHIYERVRHRLSGNERLILYDTALTEASETDKSRQPAAAGGYAVRIQTPVEYEEEKVIRAAYVANDLTVTPLYLRQSHGYIEIPSETFPCTVVWQTAPVEGRIRFLMGGRKGKKS